jgi:hypothetical protein
MAPSQESLAEEGRGDQIHSRSAPIVSPLPSPSNPINDAIEVGKPESEKSGTAPQLSIRECNPDGESVANCKERLRRIVDKQRESYGRSCEEGEIDLC